MNKNLGFALGFTAVFLFASCNYNIDKKTLAPKTEFVFSNGEEISFSIVNDQVIGVACLQCHSPNGARAQNAGDVNLVGYQNVFENRDDILNDILDGLMPKDSAPLTDAQKKLIFAWLTKGAPVNSTSAAAVLAPLKTK